MDSPADEKRVLRFGNLEDIAWAKQKGLDILENKIRSLDNELNEYYAEWGDDAPPKDDPYVKEINSAMRVLQDEKPLIESELIGFGIELDLQKNKNIPSVPPTPY